MSIVPMFNAPSNRAYTAVIFSFLAVSLFGWYAIRPTMQTIFTLKREISDRTEIDKKMEDKISALIEAQATYDSIQKDIPVLSQALPIGPEPIRALSQLRGLADETGATISGFTVPSVPLQAAPAPQKTPTASNITSIPISFSVTGGFVQVKQFLTELSDLRRITQIDSMQFSPRRISSIASESAVPTEAGTQVQVDLKLNVFYISE